VLKAYEMFGPGPLSPQDEARYWAECANAAELQTCKPEEVPRSREEVRAYFAEVRPRLCTSERAEEGMHHLLWTSPRNGAGITYAVGSRLLSLASVGTLPKWMRKLGHFDRWGIVDLLVRPAAKVIVWGATRFNSFGLIFGAPFIAPMAGQILEQHLKGEPPARLETVTPSEGRQLFGGRGRRAVAEAS
jgi:hypothetical protein